MPGSGHSIVEILNLESDILCRDLITNARARNPRQDSAS